MKAISAIIGVSILFINVVTVIAAHNNPTPYLLEGIRISENIIIDGELSESAWINAKSISKFWEKFPQDKNKARKKTEVKILYDEHFLYISAVCYDSGHYIIQTLKRDRPFIEADAFALIIDPFNEKTMAYYFAVTPYNTQTEDIIYNTFGDPNFSWDNKWFSATKVYDRYWVAEIAIPFKILKYTADKDDWGINFFRNDRKSNELHSWTNIPVQFNPWDVGYTGVVHFEYPLPRPGKNIFINPYARTGISANQLAGTSNDYDLQAGVDVKSTVLNSMSLDVTINPDFSQVDVDRQVTNLTRFNLFFPERRGFFIENNDLFSGYMGGFIQPFYSRTIGLAADGSPLPIYGGLKLSGNINSNLRAGILNVVTQPNEFTPAQNYAAFSINQKVLKRSLVKAYYFDRETIGRAEQFGLGDFGRNAGIELNYSDQPGKWNGWGGLHKSMKPGISNEDHVLHAGMAYNGQKFSTILDYAQAGTNYYADMGFVSRLENYDEEYDSVFRQGFNLHYAKFSYTLFPKKGKFNNHKFESSNLLFTNPDGSNNELTNVFRYSMIFKRSNEFRFRADHQIVWLQAYTSFTPDRSDEPLAPGRYQFINFTAYYKSDVRKKVSYIAQLRNGGFYKGTIRSVIGTLSYRVQPWGTFGADFEYNNIRFPESYGATNLYLISPRTEISFSNNLFWTTFLQYNTQRNNFNINSRIQWRFKPMSDLFLVYSDNYFTNPLFKNKNRTLVLKLNYWISV